MEKTEDVKGPNIYEGLLRSTEMLLENNQLVFSVGASYASVLVEKLKPKFPDATYAVYGETNSIIYREVDAHKVAEELNRRMANLKKQIEDYNKTLAKVVTKKR